MPTRKKPICPVCFDGALEHKAKRITSLYKGHSITYMQPGDWCSRCGEGVLSGSDVLATQERLLAWREKVDKQAAVEIASIRRRLRLTQAQAARIAGGGKNAFSRYEKGHAKPVMAVSVLFKLLDRHPELVIEAKEIAAV